MAKTKPGNQARNTEERSQVLHTYDRRKSGILASEGKLPVALQRHSSHTPRQDARAKTALWSGATRHYRGFQGMRLRRLWDTPRIFAKSGEKIVFHWIAVIVEAQDDIALGETQ